MALKNDTAAVQLHFVSGNNVLAHRSLPAPEGGPPLRIAQRMRLEASQLEGVARRMMVRGWDGLGAAGTRGLFLQPRNKHPPILPETWGFVVCVLLILGVLVIAVGLRLD